MRFTDLANRLKLGSADVAAVLAARADRIALARVRSGQLEPMAAPVGIITKRGELVFFQTDAALMKEVVEREMRGGYRGVSVRVAKGVRFSTGGVRAQSVVVGSHLEVADVGTLSITSTRVIFAGARKALDVRLDRIIGLQRYTDGLGLEVSGRANTPVFRMKDAELVCATIEAAASRS